MTPKILQWYPKYRKPKYGFTLHCRKTIWGNMLSRTWLLQQTAGLLKADKIFRHRSWKPKLLVRYVCTFMRTASPRPVTALPQVCTVWCMKLRKHLNAIMEMLYCFTVAIGLPGDASDYNEDKTNFIQALLALKTLKKHVKNLPKFRQLIQLSSSGLKNEMPWHASTDVIECVRSRWRLIRTREAGNVD